MPRPKSSGIDYFPFDVDFFSDKKIKILKSRYGADGIAVYLYILCQVYREGYFTRVDEDFKFMISDDLHMASDKVEQVMTFLFGRSMFNEQLLKSDAIITSTGIQKRWQEAVKTRAAKTPIEVDARYWLLNESETRPFIKVTLFNNSSEKNESFSEKNEGFSEKNSTKVKESKVKESKVKESKVKGGNARTRAETPLERFIQRWNINTRSMDNYSAGKAASIDWDAVSEEVGRSSFLQQQKSFGFYIKNAARILDGEWKDFAKGGAAARQPEKYDPERDGSSFANIVYE